MRPDVAPSSDPKTIRLEDYKAPDFWIDSIELAFQLDPKRTIVKTRLDVRRSISADHRAPLQLDGEGLELISLRLDGSPVGADQYEVTDKHLTVRDTPAAFILESEVAISPEANSALSGLYMSKGMFCTQCEAEGFRRITYYPDRPDVLAKFRVRIEADKTDYPVLLSNGNNTGSGDLDDGRHFAVWEDPHPKPAYLFALVGGDLTSVSDRFTTRSGREVDLHVFVQEKNKEKCGYTLDSLKRAMKWDEEVFGREYDLDIFMIVAVDHFNFGAMENKGLNIFNSAYVLASPETATDQDYENIESIVAHEYFHNWSGNRVTLRDWFQLCLKEGFTVFRDQEFSADMRSRPVQRIKDVRRLWSSQFAEDAGPLAHPPRPDHYITIDNFYTATVYEKGAEIVRMLKELLGPEKFRTACDLYFDRHDGEAATVEDFAKAMEEVGDVDLGQFRRWWTDAGRPTVSVEETIRDGVVDIEMTQETRIPTQDSPLAPRQIPISYNVLGSESGAPMNQGVFDLRSAKQTLSIPVKGERPIVSMLAGYSAPVTINQALSVADRLTILRSDPDLFSRWAAADHLWKDLCLTFAGARALENAEGALDQFASALGKTLEDAAAKDPAFVAEVLKAPSDGDLAAEVRVIDPARIVDARRLVRTRVADTLGEQLNEAYRRLASDAPFSPTAPEAAKRALRNTALSLLIAGGDSSLAVEQAMRAQNMTDEAAAASGLAASADPAHGDDRDRVLETFYDRWRDDALVVNKWLGWRALRQSNDTLENVKSLLSHAAYDMKTPNKVRAVIGVFAHANMQGFHRADGEGYAFVTDQILALDKINPQLAARLTSAFETWARLEPQRRQLAEGQLARMTEKGVSSNLYEMASRLIG